MDALGRITGVVNELGSFTTSTAAQKRAAADGTVLVNDYGSGEKQGTDSLVYLSDHLSSARAWYRVSDGQVGLAEYGAFGQRQLLAAGPGEPERGYTGHLRHAASGLVLAPYRAYDPQLARWLSEDPIMEAGGLNLYGYVGNGPVMAADPLGLIEGSQNNLAKRAVIDKIARSYNGSQLWNYGVPKGPMGANSYKCSQFVFDVAREAGARLPLIGGGFPLAGALAAPNRNLKNWRLLKPGETPMAGDIAAYPISGSSAATGHTGFIINDGFGGTTKISSHEQGVYPSPLQFTTETGLVFRRYTGE